MDLDEIVYKVLSVALIVFVVLGTVAIVGLSAYLVYLITTPFSIRLAAFMAD